MTDLMNLKAPTYALAATTSSQTISLSKNDATSLNVIVKNSTTGIIAVTSGVGSATAVIPTTSPLNVSVFLPGEVGSYQKNPADDTIAIIAAVAGNVYVQVGPGT